MNATRDSIKSAIRTILDFPKKGILYRDVTTLFKDPKGLRATISEFTARYGDETIDVVVGIESRGFIIGAILAHELGVGFVPLRKKGKLPFNTLSESYDLEYGTDELEIHTDAIQKGSQVLIVDDLIATGGTLLAGIKLIEKVGGSVVETACIVELPELKGRERIEECNTSLFSLVTFEGE
ncbi:adenine phosphoribosyltransferase [Patescibacteria group bacterium]|nr:adenine phosphoribosyltransferase [Patescibacteria group bacterium]